MTSSYRRGGGFGGGRGYRAAVSYLKSAAAAVDSDIDNRAVVFQRVVSKAVDAVSMISVRKSSAPEAATVGVRPERDFLVTVTGPAGGISGAPFLVSFKEQRAGGRIGLSSSKVSTDNDGVAAFSHPPPGVAGEGVVYFTLSFAPELQPLKLLTGQEDEIIRGFERAATRAAVEFRFPVLSESMRYDTAVYIIEKSENGVQGSGKSQTEAGIIASLSEGGFRIVPFTRDLRLPAGSVSTFVETVKEEQLTRARRVVYGEAEITGSSVEGGIHLVSVEARIEVVDLETGTIVHTIDGSRTGRGRSREAAVTAAYRELGNQVGRALVRELP